MKREKKNTLIKKKKKQSRKVERAVIQKYLCVTQLVESCEPQTCDHQLGKCHKCRCRLDVVRLRLDRICRSRLVHREVPWPCSNNKRFFFW